MIPSYLKAFYSLSIALTVIGLGYIITLQCTLRDILPKGEGNGSPWPSADNRNMWDIFQRNKTSKFGYVMATHYSDQMTGSMANLASLQCWASTLGPDIRLVEPFLRHSALGVNLYATYNRTIRREVPPYDDNSVALSDILDMLEWEKFAQEKENRWSPQIGWDSSSKMLHAN